MGMMSFTWYILGAELIFVEANNWHIVPVLPISTYLSFLRDVSLQEKKNRTVFFCSSIGVPGFK